MTERTIPKPDPAREPMKANVYRFVQNSTVALAPLFPYIDEGAIVPCATSFRGGPGKSFGRFQHFNTVDEVAIVFGASGQLQRGAGLVRVGPKLHMVQPMMPDPGDPGTSGIVVITQRQAIGKPQREEIRFVCEKCDRRLFIHECDATPPKRGVRRPPSVAALPTLAESAEAARRFNADAAGRKCKHCGHQNPPFPSADWGWDTHVSQTEVIEMATRSMERAPSAPPQPGAPGSGAPGPGAR
ncbi:MAG: hypothetical protein ACREFQ_20590 [Stellaceae bacterium]